MNTDNLRGTEFIAFVKDLFTLRTVWIDKGRGRWAVKKRLHPLMKAILCTLGLILCAVVYSGLNSPGAVKAEPQPVMLAAKLPEPEILPIPEAKPRDITQENTPIAPPVQSRQNIIIPLTTKKPDVQHNVSVWPTSESDTESGRSNPLKPSVPTAPQSAVNTPASTGRYNIKINKSAYTLTLYKGNDPVKSYSIAVGRNPGDKQRKGDNRTPVGDFKIVSIENASGWSHDFRDGKGRIAGAYGPWFLRLDAKGWKGIGIHGTHDPDSRGTMATEGCIRLSNEDIVELKQYAYRNMPVVIREN